MDFWESQVRGLWADDSTPKNRRFGSLCHFPLTNGRLRISKISRNIVIEPVLQVWDPEAAKESSLMDSRWKRSWYQVSISMFSSACLELNRNINGGKWVLRLEEDREWGHRCVQFKISIETIGRSRTVEYPPQVAICEPFRAKWTGERHKQFLLGVKIPRRI